MLFETIDLFFPLAKIRTHVMAHPENKLPEFLNRNQNVACKMMLNAYAKCGHQDAPKSVLEILSFLEKECEKGNLHLKPNGAIYNVGELETISK